ncbi:MAG: hypothetical protein LLF96_06270 [Eubacteriales bacterium]|nr:hypothetical protein [Eubacteriales bacterium]
MRAYIQFRKAQSTVWMQGDMLVALFAGDVQCMDDGVGAYLADEDNAILFVCKENNPSEIESLREQEVVRDENYSIIAFEKTFY